MDIQALPSGVTVTSCDAGTFITALWIVILNIQANEITFLLFPWCWIVWRDQVQSVKCNLDLAVLTYLLRRGTCSGLFRSRTEANKIVPVGSKFGSRMFYAWICETF